MFKRVRSRMTYANVASSLALLFALSTGGAYAANTIGSGDVINESLLSEDIKNGEVKNSDLGAASVTTGKIKDGEVHNSDLTANSIGSGRIADGAIKTEDLATGAATGSKIRNGAVTSSKVLDDTAAGGGLGSADLAGDSVGSAEIQTDAVQATEVADNSIDAGEIVDFGLTNQDVGVLFAQVNADGTIANSSGGVTGIHLGTGTYEVDFGVNIAGCAFTATEGEASVGGAGGAIMGVTDRSGNPEGVFATARDANGALVDRPYQLVVVC